MTLGTDHNRREKEEDGHFFIGEELKMDLASCQGNPSSLRTSPLLLFTKIIVVEEKKRKKRVYGGAGARVPLDVFKDYTFAYIRFFVCWLVIMQFFFLSLLFSFQGLVIMRGCSQVTIKW